MDSVKTILIALEIGGNFGHLTRAVRIADELVRSSPRDIGYRVVMAVPDVQAAAALGGRGFTLLQSPKNNWTPAPLNRPLINHAEILKLQGYTVVSGNNLFAGLISSWAGLIDTVNPDLVMVDYAPTALLAARLRGKKTLAIGSGFDLPPVRQGLMPAFLTLNNEPFPEQELARLEDEVVQVVNQSINQVGANMTRFSALFDADRRVLTTLPELRPWASEDTRHEQYVGPIDSSDSYPVVRWEDDSDDTKRIFAYLQPGMSNTRAIMEALDELDAEVVCVVPASATELPELKKNSRLRVIRHLVNLGALLHRADAVVNYGGAGIVAMSLIYGVPMVLAPNDVEKVITSRHAERLGAAAIAAGESKEDFAGAINEVLFNPSYTKAAEVMFQKYEEYRYQWTCFEAIRSLIQYLTQESQ